jgi:hypothetical protein
MLMRENMDNGEMKVNKQSYILWKIFITEEVFKGLKISHA